MPDNCCLCGNDSEARFCRHCGHSFCETCRELFFHRGVEALKQFLTRKPPRHCRGHKEP